MDAFSINGVDFCPSILSHGVAACEEYGRSHWLSKRVTLTNEACDVVARGVCQPVESFVVLETHGSPLG